jgi:hypothetical protein
MSINHKIFPAFLFLLMMGSSFLFAQDKAKTTPKPTEINQIAGVSCGQCNFKLNTQKGCDLAVRLDGKAYFIDGTKIDDHGDAHADDGFCNAIKKAEVRGTIVGGRFKASYFKLITE